MTAGSGIAVLVLQGTVHDAVPVPVLTNLDAASILVMFAGRPVKILAAYLSPPVL